jgi:hypothetical protein
VCGVFEWSEIVHFFFNCLFISVLLLEIQVLKYGECWDIMVNGIKNEEGYYMVNGIKNEEGY